MRVPFRNRQRGFWWVPIAAAAAGSVVQGMFNAEQAEENRDFQAEQSATAHQREVADLRAAGLNPILSATGGRGASTPSGAQASINADWGGAAASAVQLQRQEAEIDLLRAQATKTRQETDTESERTQGLKWDNDARRPFAGDDVTVSLPDVWDAEKNAPMRTYSHEQERHFANLQRDRYEAGVRKIARDVAETYGLSSAEAALRVQNALEKLQQAQRGKALSEVGLNAWELNFLNRYGLAERGIKALGIGSSAFRNFSPRRGIIINK